MTVITRQPPSCARLTTSRQSADFPMPVGPRTSSAAVPPPATERSCPMATASSASRPTNTRSPRRTPAVHRSYNARVSAPGCAPNSRTKAIRKRSYQRMATCRWSALIAARISSRHAASSVGSTSMRRSQSALRRSSSVRRAWTRRRGSWVHASYGASGSSSPGHPAATFAHASLSGSRSASSASSRKRSTSVVTVRAGNSSTRPERRTIASGSFNVRRAWWAAFRRLAAPASAPKCGQSCSMT